MNPVLKNILAVIIGVIVGGLINGGIIYLGPHLVAPPEGVNPMDVESIRANIHLYELKHFLVPFFAHALGTLVGAFVAAKASVGQHRLLAIIVGAIFLVGGVMMVLDVGGPLWFKVLDIGFAYLPAATIGWYLSGRPAQ